MVANITNLIENMKVLSLDMHMASTRPCSTCLSISNSLGYHFGCYELIKKTGRGKLPELIKHKIK